MLALAPCFSCTSLNRSATAPGNGSVTLASPSPTPGLASTPSFTPTPTPPLGPSPISNPGPTLATLVSGVPWYDNSGALLNAHSVGVFEAAGTWYMVGERRTTDNYLLDGDYETNFAGINCYSSNDLTHWSYVGIVLGVTPGTPLDGNNPVERPKVLYNSITQNT